MTPDLSRIEGRERNATARRLSTPTSPQKIQVSTADPPFIAPDGLTYTFDLPFPTSANRIWRHGKGRVQLSEEYKAWRREADKLASYRRALVNLTTIRTAFEVQIYFCRDRSNGDLDNLLKAPMDWLQRSGVIANDRLCAKILAEWVPHALAPFGCRVTVTERG